MDCVDKKFWLENPGALLSNIQVVPLNTVTLAEQLNAVTRLVFIVAIIMWLFNFKYTPHFLIISLVFIICIYYIQKRTMQRCQENYENKPRLPSSFYEVQPYDMKNLTTTTKKVVNGQPIEQTYIQTSEVLPFCNDAVDIDPPQSFAVSLNQQLVGTGVNPVTKIKPVVVPPIFALDYWKENNLVTFPQINTAGPQEDMYLSGYAESTCCGYLGGESELVPQPKQTKEVLMAGDYRENYTPINNGCGPQSRLIPQMPYKSGSCARTGGQIRSPIPVEDTPYVPTIPIRNPGVNAPRYALPKENYSRSRESYAPRGGCGNRIPASKYGLGSIVSPTPVEDIPFVPEMPVDSNPDMPVVGTPFVNRAGRNGPLIEHFRYETIDNPNQVYVQPNQSGWVNTACGYDADAVFESGLPSNLPAGNCEQDPAMKQYNENLFTSIITPGVYTRNQVNEPINSNIGISFQQQFEPVSCRREDKGLIYTQHDPRIIEPVLESEIPSDCVREKATYDNVYDPRFYGYGTSYRSYNEPVLNQTRFFYDDINATRMPSYITRSKIDHLPYADTYQSPPDGSENGNIHNPHIRALAQDSWFRDSMQFRNDLTERRMRKINSEAWQKRQFPNSARPVGSYKRSG